MFTNILFATSATAASDHAARVAFNIAERYHAKLNLFHVMGVPTRGYSQVVVDVKTGDRVQVDDDYKAWVEDEIKTYYASQMKTGVDTTISVAVGYPHREILRQARDISPDLIILGGHTGPEGESTYRKGTVDSTFERVAKAAPCPCLFVNRPAASFWGGLSNIVFGTDFSKASDRAFDFTCSIARALDCELHIFHALDISSAHMGRSMSQDEIEQKIREALRMIRARYVKKLEGINRYSIEVWEGIPYVEIVKYARENHADLIVMAHHSRKVSDDDSTIGSNMEQVIVRAGCPVVSVNR